MAQSTQIQFHLIMDANKLDSSIKSFEYNGNYYLYVCHLDIYSDIPGGHKDDKPNQVKILIKSFYGKYLDLIVPVDEFDTDPFYITLSRQIDDRLISLEGSY